MFLIEQKSPEHVPGLFLKKFKNFFQKVSKQSYKLVIYIEAIIGKNFRKSENTFQKIERRTSTLMRYDPEKVCERILKQIRRYSEREGLTMSSLAREAGLSASTISEMMCGKTRPQVYTLMKICNVLDVSMDVLMGEFMEDGEVPEKPARRLPVQRVYNALPEWKQKRVREFIEMIADYEP